MGHRPRHAFDVGGERRVVLDVIGRVLAHHVDDARIGLLGVVQIGEPVGEAGAEMEQGRGRFPSHPVIAVGGPRQHPFEEPQHAAHARHLVEGGHEMHLGRARVGEADIDPSRQQGSHEALGAVHVGVIGHVCYCSHWNCRIGNRLRDPIKQIQTGKFPLHSPRSDACTFPLGAEKASIGVVGGRNSQAQAIIPGPLGLTG